MILTPKPVPGHAGFKVTFRHPIQKDEHGRGKVVSFGLGTQDETEAEAICRDVELIFKDPTLLEDPASPRLLAYKPRAVRIVHGEQAAERVESQKMPTLDDADIGTLVARITALVNADAEQSQLIEAALAKFENKRYAELKEQYTTLENLVKTLKPRNEFLEIQNEKMERAHNLHVKISIEKAFEKWKESNGYTGLSPKTQTEVVYAVEKFIASLPEQGRTQLGKIRARHVMEWLDKVEGQNGKVLSVVTKTKMKRYVGAFLTEVVSKYDLSENPMLKTRAIKGAALVREHIKAIDRFKDLTEMLDAVKSISAYWHALLATAVLTGPRYSELAWLQIKHVNLEGNFIRIATREHNGVITGTKTGKERNVPIETTILRPLLVAHIQRRKEEQRKKGASAGERSPWLFPSTVPENEHKPRSLMPIGIWANNNVFLAAWHAIAAEAAKVTGPRDYWYFGPREWRHCGGTSMGHTGNDSARISCWLGTSEAMCKKHYCKPSTSGATWPLAY